jgi:membrane protein
MSTPESPVAAPSEPAPAHAPASAPAPPARTFAGALHGLERRGLLTLKYLLRTEVHTYAFSVAANAILSFFPFMVLLLTLTRRVFRSQAMFNVVLELLREYLPTAQDFVIRNLRVVSARQGVQVFSLVMLLITSNGVFLPLEVALNQVWGFRKNRSYLGNQIVSLTLTLACGLLALLSVALTASNQSALQTMLGGRNLVFRTWAFVVMKAFAITASIAIFFLIYWLLPNGKVPARAVLPAAVVTGILWELAKYAYVLALPWLSFQDVYGPFSISVTLMFWAFLSGLLLLGGAHLSASGCAGANGS